MDGKVSVSIDELRMVAQSLRKQNEELQSQYTGTIKSVLDSSAACLNVAGVDISSINSAYSKVFSDINTGMEQLIDVLENSVIKNYSELSEALKKMFNSDFKNKMEELLGVVSGNSSSSTSSTASSPRPSSVSYPTSIPTPTRAPQTVIADTYEDIYGIRN